eukprot:TRINITY_DN27089_c0_g1_i4.p1 TRINITY_DN27089_c0_g1~~TRINITY_DN27089_c0_g1_i4.p1  ORF type:complete len:602 (+),score=135.35 TRINITY_DN27089_c0_g1_i4:441-2246(+)
MGLERSEQLRRLYESLSAGDSNQQSKRPSASLSPEDLTDTEWYYLVCMSFTFNPGQGLPGRALANGHHIWLCNAHLADSKVFTRSLLAKSASIQTVVCFPLMSGVLELGVTELISEDLPLLQHVKTSFLEFSMPVCSEQSTSSTQEADKDEDHTCTELDHEIVNSMHLEKLNSVADCEMQTEDAPSAFPFSLHSYIAKDEIELDQDRIEELNPNIFDELKMGSSDGSSNGCVPNQNTDDSFMLEGPNGASQVQSWQFMDDEHSCDCISQSLANPVKVVPLPKGEKVTNQSVQDQQESNHNKLSLLGLETEDPHYTKTLSAIFRNCHRLIAKTYFHNGSCESSFVVWRKDLDTEKPQASASQKMLKKILFEVVWMHDGFSPKTLEEVGSKGIVWKFEGDDIGAKHAFSERRRREKLNEKFLILSSLVPSITKVDQASVLGDTIDYLKELEQRVDELEACKESGESEVRQRRKHPDITERTSDNYGHNENANGKKPSINKRKASNIDAADAELNWVLSKDNLADMTVTVIEKEVLIEMLCPWRECLLLEIVDAISTLHLDAHSVQSSTTDGILTLKLRSKFRGAAVASVGMIKQALQRVVAKC